MSYSISLPDNSLRSYYGAKKPFLQPKEHSDAKINFKDNWMPSPLVLNCPPGLEYLTKIDKFFVNKNHDPHELQNRYLIKNGLAEKVYTANESKISSNVKPFLIVFSSLLRHSEYDKRCMICCNTNRLFDIKVFDFHEREVLNFHRTLGCQSCWCPCCLQSVEVTASGTLCGFIKQSWSPFLPKFRICDATGKTVLLIKGPCDINYILTKFKVLSCDGKTKVGHVSAHLASIIPEQLPNDHSSISFPMDLDFNIKAVLLAASILIDRLFYKSAQKTNGSLAIEAGCEVRHCLTLCLAPWCIHLPSDS
ncbi:phospholipid scramblase 2-like isoform X1 [Tetranychus urticae]|uniref:phospholipid scramblase 2-like isoform X1 n=1 Tax=Tetranychus urticae TaxID=32264 RepID=UPI000D64B175|nr:phospholipid scramblase 2-like isoform X1 [Tetranychus urticae]